MEVHHHPNVEKKKFKEYFLEFLMIFLAVTMGFFAENIRENITDHQRGKEYIKSYVEDLGQDSITLQHALVSISIEINYLDSAMILLQQRDLKQNMASNYYYARQATRFQTFSFAERTIIQLTNAGGFRLINNEAADSILYYQSLIERYKVGQGTETEESKLLYPFIAKVFDGRIFVSMTDSLNQIKIPAGNPLLKSEDIGAISDLIYYLHQKRSTFFTQKLRVKKMLAEAGSIKKFLYHLYHFNE
ncbi:MAG TPA: hypothetical protein VK787_11530 [Puia sp.]|jgi:hypothetical protein|nr:hypothetical protein [Puia sp.]